MLAYSEFLALAILIAGFIVARLASVAAGRLLGVVDRRTAQYATTDSSVLTPGLIRFSRSVTFWLFFILSVVLSLRVLGISGFSSLLDPAIAFMPRMLIAFSIVIIGYLIGLVARHLSSEIVGEGGSQNVLPRLLQATIVAVAVVVGLQQVGVDISFITRLVLILAATVSAGIMLTFALGARQHVANLLARRELERLSTGSRVRIGDVEGNIVDIYPTGVDIATREGVASVPAAQLAEHGILRIEVVDKDD